MNLNTCKKTHINLKNIPLGRGLGQKQKWDGFNKWGVSR